MAVRILVVDDEPFMRELVISLLSEEETDYVVAGEAINGALALELLRKEPAEIVITDIKMPVMDGLDLLREAARGAYSTGFVVLSAYDEFHLVKEAFKLGARDYLLKSEITRDDLLRVLDRVARSILDERKMRGPAGEYPLLCDLLSGKLDSPLRSLRAMGVGGGRRFRIATVRTLGEKRRIYFRPETDFSENGLAGKILKFAETAAGENVFLAPMDGGVTGLFCFPEDSVGDELTEKFFGFVSALAADEGLEAVGGMSSFSSDPEKFPLLRREASIAESFWFFRGRGRLFAYSKTSLEGASVSSRDRSGQADRLRRLIDLKNAKQIGEQTKDLFARAFHPSPEDAASIRELFLAYHACLRKAVEREENFLDFKMALEEFDSYVRDEGTLDEYNRWLGDTLFVFCEILKSRCPLVRKTVEYVNSNFCRDLRLSEVARRLGVSEAHISRTFSREMKCSFVQYLSTRRMNHALRLLRTTDLKIYEIAERIGYSNTEHFSRMFKKIMGRSPKEYR